MPGAGRVPPPSAGGTAVPGTGRDGHRGTPSPPARRAAGHPPTGATRAIDPHPIHRGQSRGWGGTPKGPGCPRGASLSPPQERRPRPSTGPWDRAEVAGPAPAHGDPSPAPGATSGTFPTPNQSKRGNSQAAGGVAKPPATPAAHRPLPWAKIVTTRPAGPRAALKIPRPPDSDS